MINLIPRTSFSRIAAALVIVLALSFLSLTQPGCSSGVEITAKQASKADDTIKKTEFSLWWGFSDRTESVDCGGQGLQFVSTKTNWLYSLCAVVTLGAVVPLDVEYRCTSVPLQDGGPIGELEREKP